jgi:phenylacetate-CoA ligase
MGTTDRLYSLLPPTIQNVGISLYGLHWKRRRFGGVFHQELDQFRDRENYSAEQWRNFQTVKLRALLDHAFETVPFYREKYSAAGFTRDDLSRFEIEDLKRLPYLEKDELRQYGRTTMVSTKPEKGGSFFGSSGSTGTPTSILYSHAFHQRWSAAFEARVRNWAGLDHSTPRGMIGGRRVVTDGESRPPYFRYNCFERQTYFSAYHISAHSAANYLEGMRKHNVAYMTGYAMSNYFLAQYFEHLGLEAPRLSAVVTSSEKLTPAMRETFRQVYGCKTFDGYSGVEACGLITENESGELMVSPDVGIMELLDDDGRDTAPGGTGEIVSTGLLNFDQPLIRYRIGDMARVAKTQQSATGRSMPIIEEIVGRVEDTVVGPDGRRMVRFHGVFIDLPAVKSAQVVQKAIDHLNILLLTDSSFSKEDEDTIVKRVRSQLGEVIVDVQQVDQLRVESSGKVKAVISELERNQVD